jgi:iron-sulfur cluster repair protein YtfE (RIC family)
MDCHVRYIAYFEQDEAVLIASSESAIYHTVIASVTPVFDVSRFILDRAAEHHALLAGSRLTNLRALATEASEANAQMPELAAMDHTVATFCNDLRECFAREESMVFPALLRLQTQTHVSRCQAGMIRARLRFMVAEQDALLLSLSDAGDIARRHLSPTGPCESCHQLLLAIESLQADLHPHVAREQDELFAWALAREDALIAQISD